MDESKHNRLRDKAVILIPALNPPDTFTEYVRALTRAGFQDILTD